MSDIHWKVKQALEEVDACVFNGDTFEDPANQAVLKDYMDRWKQQLLTKRTDTDWDYQDDCIICDQEGGHDTDDRPHVMKGQE